MKKKTRAHLLTVAPP